VRHRRRRRGGDHSHTTNIAVRFVESFLTFWTNLRRCLIVYFRAAWLLVIVLPRLPGQFRSQNVGTCCNTDSVKSVEQPCEDGLAVGCKDHPVVGVTLPSARCSDRGHKTAYFMPSIGVTSYVVPNLTSPEFWQPGHLNPVDLIVDTLAHCSGRIRPGIDVAASHTR